MRYLDKSFTLPASNLKGRNTHGQTWDDIFKPEPLIKVEPPRNWPDPPAAAQPSPTSPTPLLNAHLTGDDLDPARGICAALVACICIWAGLAGLICWWVIR